MLINIMKKPLLEQATESRFFQELAAPKNNNSQFLSKLASGYRALILAGTLSLFATGCTTNVRNNGDVSSLIEKANPIFDSLRQEVVAIASLVNNKKFPFSLYKKITEVVGSMDSASASIDYLNNLRELKNFGVKVFQIMEKGDEEQKKYAKELALLVESLLSTSTIGISDESSPLKKLLSSTLLNIYYSSVNSANQSALNRSQINPPIQQNNQTPRVDIYQSKPQLPPVIDNKTKKESDSSTNYNNQNSPTLPVNPPQKRTTIVVPEPLKLEDLFPKPVPKPNAGTQQNSKIISPNNSVSQPKPRSVTVTPNSPVSKENNDTQDTIVSTDASYFDSLWENLDNNKQFAFLKREINRAYKLPHRWKQLKFLLANSGLKEVFYYLRISSSIKLNLSRVLFNSMETKTESEILARFLQFLERVETSKLATEKKENPSLSNISGSLAKLERLFARGINAPRDQVVVVDVSQQLLYLVNRTDQGNYSIQGTMPVSTARSGTYQNTNKVIDGKTPIGAMQVENKWGGSKPINQIYDSGWKKGRARIRRKKAGNSSAVMMGRLFPLRSLSRKTPTSGIYIHATNLPLYLGQFASHGCIRVSPEDAKRLYSKLDKRTLVYIQH